MKLVQAREWAQIYIRSPHALKEEYSLEDMLIDAYTAGWREGWDDGEMCDYNRGRERPPICPECSLVEGKHKLDCSYGR